MTWWQTVVLVLFLAAVVFYTVKVIRTQPEPPPSAEPARTVDDSVGPARKDAG